MNENTKEQECCTDHSIIWDMESIEIRQGDGSPDGEFDEAIEFKGQCQKCKRVFLKTFVDPRYSELKQPDNELVNTYREQIAIQAYSNEKAKVYVV